MRSHVRPLPKKRVCFGFCRLKICGVDAFQKFGSDCITLSCSFSSGSKKSKCIVVIWPLAGQKRSESPDFVLLEKIQCILENGCNLEFLKCSREPLCVPVTQHASCVTAKPPILSHDSSAKPTKTSDTETDRPSDQVNTT